MVTSLFELDCCRLYLFLSLFLFLTSSLYHSSAEPFPINPISNSNLKSNEMISAILRFLRAQPTVAIFDLPFASIVFACAVAKALVFAHINDVPFAFSRAMNHIAMGSIYVFLTILTMLNVSTAVTFFQDKSLDATFSWYRFFLSDDLLQGLDPDRVVNVDEWIYGSYLWMALPYFILVTGTMFKIHYMVRDTLDKTEALYQNVTQGHVYNMAAGTGTETAGTNAKNTTNTGNAGNIHNTSHSNTCTHTTGYSAT